MDKFEEDRQKILNVLKWAKNGLLIGQISEKCDMPIYEVVYILETLREDSLVKSEEKKLHKVYYIV